MDAFPLRRSVLPVLLLAAALLAACSPAASSSPSGASASPSGAASSAASPSSSASADASPSPSAEPSASAAAFPVTLTDFLGTQLEIPEEPQSIVSLTPAATETLFAIGAGDRVTGKVEDIANYPPEAADVPVVATFSGVDVERIVSLEPDLVIAGGNAGTPDQAIEQMRRLELPVLVVYAEDVDGVFADIELIGDAVGRGEEAADLVASMRAGFDQVEAATSDVERPRVFYETGDQPAIYGVADESFIAAMLELAGGDPITTGSTTTWEMPQERLVEADPEVILLGDAAYGVTEESVAGRPGWADLTAVREGEIHPIDDIVVTRPGPRLLEGLHALVAAIHPETELPEASGGAPSASTSASAAPSASGAGG